MLGRDAVYIEKGFPYRTRGFGGWRHGELLLQHQSENVVICSGVIAALGEVGLENALPPALGFVEVGLDFGCIEGCGQTQTWYDVGSLGVPSAGSSPQAGDVLVRDGAEQLAGWARLVFDNDDSQSGNLVDAGILAQPQSVLLDDVYVVLVVRGRGDVDRGRLLFEGRMVRALVARGLEGRARAGEEGLDEGVVEEVDDGLAALAVPSRVHQGRCNKFP